MTTAICLTPDRRFFGPALYTAARIVATGLPSDTHLLLACEEEDIWQGYDKLDPALRDKISIVTAPFGKLIGDVPKTKDDSTAIYRRLVLDRVLPREYTRIIAVDADMDVGREGLSPLAAVDLQGAPLAAALDMIFLMDFGGHLKPQFQAYRLGLGLSLSTPYFNNGLIVIDRPRWEDEALGERALRFIIENRKACQFFDQSALNALLKGRFAPLSPRWNFMGDFFLLDLEREIAPIVYHFVLRPKPWEQGFAGEARFAKAYREWFAASPWPDFAALPAKTSLPPVKAGFRARLLEYLGQQRFIDGWAP